MEEKALVEEIACQMSSWWHRYPRYDEGGKPTFPPLEDGYFWVWEGAGRNAKLIKVHTSDPIARLAEARAFEILAEELPRE